MKGAVPVEVPEEAVARAVDVWVDVPVGVSTCADCWTDGPSDELCPAHRAEYEASLAAKARAWLDGIVAERQAIIEAIRDAVPLALPSNYDDLPRCVRGLAMQRDSQHELKDHLAEVARRLTDERAAAYPLIAARVQAEAVVGERQRIAAALGAGVDLAAKLRLGWLVSYRRVIEIVTRAPVERAAIEDFDLAEHNARTEAVVRAGERRRISAAILAACPASAQYMPRDTFNGMRDAYRHAAEIALEESAASEMDSPDRDARVRAEERQRMLAAMEQPAFMQAAIDRAQLTTFTDDGG